MSTSPRPLTHDMRQAAESAYQGRPLNPRWSLRAQAIYQGIWHAKHEHRPDTTPPVSETPHHDPRPTTHYSRANPFIHTPLQAWHLAYTDGEHVLLLFPHHAQINFVFHVTKELAGRRHFTLHPIQYGHFHIQWPTNGTIQTLYSHDIRVMDQDGMLHIPSQLPKRPPLGPHTNESSRS